jgi:hypothetical protein
MSPESILLSWKPPTQPNGVVAHYTVYVKESGDGKSVCIFLAKIAIYKLF